MNGFPAGTKVNTPKGYRFIEDLKKGDEVFAYTLATLEPGEFAQPGRVFAAKVTKTTKSSGAVLELSYFAVADHGLTHDGVLSVGADTEILTPGEDDYKLASELKVGDTIWTEYGDSVLITAVNQGAENDLYALEVEKFKTYIAGAIRVKGQ